MSASSFGFLSTYPPTQCGLATFTASLGEHLRQVGSGCEIGVVRVVDAPEPSSGPEVVHQLVKGSDDSAREAAEVLNRFDVVIVQHEYGIFGGDDGEELLEVLRRVAVPVIAVLHTVLESPSPHQREVLEDVVRSCDAVVTMTKAAGRRLVDGYDVDASKLTVIPHGADDNRLPPGREQTPPSRPTILTWGLIGPGKGIEWAVEALASLRDLDPPPRYLVAGQTHPRVREEEGEKYREGLAARAEELGVSHMLQLDDSYMDDDTLEEIRHDATVVLLPYDSVEQVTSGVLIEAVTAGKPVVSTRFPHAIELLGTGAGLVVPQRDPEAIATALRRVLTEPGLAERMAEEASRLTPQVLWPTVAQRYHELGQKLVRAGSSAVA